MKKFKAIATKKNSNDSNKIFLDKKEFKSYKFTFFAKNFTEAWAIAEREAKKGLSLFESLKVIKL